MAKNSELARKGQTVERDAVPVNVRTKFCSYSYPYLAIEVECSKGTYIRSIAHDLGQMLGCGAHLKDLTRLRSGAFRIDACIDGAMLDQPDCCVTTLKSTLIKEGIATPSKT